MVRLKEVRKILYGPRTSYVYDMEYENAFGQTKTLAIPVSLDSNIKVYYTASTGIIMNIFPIINGMVMFPPTFKIPSNLIFLDQSLNGAENLYIFEKHNLFDLNNIEYIATIQKPNYIEIQSLNIDFISDNNKYAEVKIDPYTNKIKYKELYKDFFHIRNIDK